MNTLEQAYLAQRSECYPATFSGLGSNPGDIAGVNPRLQTDGNRLDECGYV